MLQYVEWGHKNMTQKEKAIIALEQLFSLIGDYLMTIPVSEKYLFDTIYDQRVISYETLINYIIHTPCKDVENGA